MGPAWAAEVQEVCLPTAEPILHIITHKECLTKKQTILTFVKLWMMTYESYNHPLLTCFALS